MTTIAYDGNFLAADSQGACSFIEQAQMNKIREVDGYWIAGSGNFSSVLRWVDWFKDGADKAEYPEWGDRLQGVFVVSMETGLLQVWGPSDPYPSVEWSRVPNALGSGEQFAMGAMLAGCDAMAAVRIAAQLDEGTGGKIRWISMPNSSPA